MNSADFLHADCDSLIFGQASIVVYILNFSMPVYCSYTCQTPSSSQKGPMKQGLSIPSCFLLGCFLGIGSLVFSGARKPYQVVHSPPSPQKKKKKKKKKWAKNRPKVGLFEFKEKKVSYQFFLNLFYNENLHYLLCSCTNRLFRKNVIPETKAKMLSAIQIARFLNQAFVQSKSMRQPHFFAF